MRSIEDQPESLKSGCAHSRLSPLWNFQGPVKSAVEVPRTTCSAHCEIGDAVALVVEGLPLSNACEVSAHKAQDIVPRVMAATSRDIFVLVTDNRNTRIWEVASPHRGLSFFGPIGMPGGYAFQPRSGNTNCLIWIVRTISCHRPNRSHGYVMSSVSYTGLIGLFFGTP